MYWQKRVKVWSSWRCWNKSFNSTHLFSFYFDLSLLWFLKKIYGILLYKMTLEILHINTICIWMSIYSNRNCVILWSGYAKRIEVFSGDHRWNCSSRNHLWGLQIKCIFESWEGYPHKSITHSLRCSVHGIPRAITMIVPGYQLRL